MSRDALISWAPLLGYQEDKIVLTSPTAKEIHYAIGTMYCDFIIPSKYFLALYADQFMFLLTLVKAVGVEPRPQHSDLPHYKFAEFRLHDAF